VGDMTERVLANRKSIKLDLGFAYWQELHQVHGTDMVFDPEPTEYQVPASLEGDGLATKRSMQALIIKTADCQPILLTHASGRFIAALHVGWRGNAARFPTTGVTAFCERYKLDPKDVLAVRGPSLCPEASCFTDFDNEFGREFSQWYEERNKCVDLWRLTRDQLLEAGLKPGNIFSLDLCTHHHPDLFFSYRRNRKTGRQASLVWIKRLEEC
jgi:hypothetical protein